MQKTPVCLLRTINLLFDSLRVRKKEIQKKKKRTVFGTLHNPKQAEAKDTFKVKVKV